MARPKVRVKEKPYVEKRTGVRGGTVGAGLEARFGGSCVMEIYKAVFVIVLLAKTAVRKRGMNYMAVEDNLIEPKLSGGTP